MKILVINGPNLNMLGIREPDKYGRETYDELLTKIDTHCRKRGIEVDFYQSNHEGALVDRIQQAYFDKTDAIVINPADYERLRLAKDSNLQYYGGGYFYGPYGNSDVIAQPGIWGRQTVVTTAVAAGTALVGAFKAGGTVVGKAGEGA